MKKQLLAILMIWVFAGNLAALNCDFTVASKVCVNQEVKVLYTGGVTANATYLWNFDGAIVISGTGQGPYYVKWETPGEKHVTLSIAWEGQTCNATRPVVVVEHPQQYHMTGGGLLVPGGPGVEVGLSGSEAGVFYKLRRDGVFVGQQIMGTGPISFGLQTVPGVYTAVGKLDGSDCMAEMLGEAVVSSTPVESVNICMVTFDTLHGRNKVVWNKPASVTANTVNIYCETYQNNHYSKIGEVAWTAPGFYLDTTANPLTRSDRYKISLTDAFGNETDKSPHHKTIHLNINPGTYGFNLIWNHYEGFEFFTYRIHRMHNQEPWEVIDSVASNVDSYTDLYTGSGLMTYRIEVVRPSPCQHFLKEANPEPLMSNPATAAPLGVGDNDQLKVVVYPNPAVDKLFVANLERVSYQVVLQSAGGLTLRTMMVDGPWASIDLAGLPGGVYLMKISGHGETLVRKVVKL